MISVTASENSNDYVVAYLQIGSRITEDTVKHSNIIFGPYPFSRSNGILTPVNVADLNTQPPKTFGYGYFSDYGIARDNNVSHAQVTGHLDLTKIEFESSRAAFVTDRITALENNIGHFISNEGASASRPGYYWAYSALSGTWVSAKNSSYPFMLNPEHFESSLGTSVEHFFNVSPAGYENVKTVYNADGSIRISGYVYTLLRTYPSTTYRIRADYTVSWIQYIVDDPTSFISGSYETYAYFIVSSATATSSSPEITENFVSDIQSRLKTVVSQAFSACDRVSYYDACKSALQSVSYIKMDNLENMTQLADPSGLLPPIRDIMRIRTNPAKGIASLYLWIKYAVNTSVADIIDVAENYLQIMSNLAAQYEVNYSKYGVSYAKIRFFDSDELHVILRSRVDFSSRLRTAVERANNNLNFVGFGASSESLWNIIPFSFVVDWFTSFGDLLNDIDYNLFDANRYKIHHVVESAKFSTTLPFSTIGINVENDSGFEFSYYYRRATRALPPMELSFGSSNPTNHIFDGLALIVANW